MKDITLVLMTCGELTEKRCLQAIQPFREEVEFFEVRNVCPQIQALNQMIEQVKTEFFIPLDADIVLHSDAWDRIKAAVAEHGKNEKWHSILWPLWDSLTQKRILALKLLRSDIAKENPFIDGPTPDVEHYQRLTKQGYTCIHSYLTEEPIGIHVVQGRQFCYAKYRDVYQTYRFHNFEWDNGVFLGGHDLRSRAKNHFDYFLYQFLKTDNEDYLYCIAGMMDGILSPIQEWSKNLQQVNFLVQASQALDSFYDWYLDAWTGTMLF